MPEEHNHGGSEHWEHVDIPEHYEVVIHGDHVHLGQFEPAHIGYYRQGEVLEQPQGMPPQIHPPEGFHWVGIPGHYDQHGNHTDYEAPHWGLHGQHS
ncbi:hypothetical protein [Priestia megaterium]|uniref:hypothetical protein n=1 Tax=Priestia megaterium TaxID=1404 RepID=UPI00159C2813|nr:hypothetical protein [Priestia megaterium]